MRVGPVRTSASGIEAAAGRCAWAVVSAPIRLARCVSVIALAASARIPFAARVSNPLPSCAQVAFVASGALAACFSPPSQMCRKGGYRHARTRGV